MEVEFNRLSESDLIVDCVYKGGKNNNAGDDPLHYLFECGVMGGFRKVTRQDGSGKTAYVVLYSSMSELEWPDYLDEASGVFRYYGDNRQPGRELHNTKFRGNALLRDVFAVLNSGGHYDEIPPFFVFTKAESGRDVKFLGLAVPGNPNISPDKDLVAFWRTVKNNRFQNYEAYFTILDTGHTAISRKWIYDLVHDYDNSIDSAPSAWTKFIKYGRAGITPLKSPKIFEIPTKFRQLQSDNEGKHCLEYIREHYKTNPYGFESCAVDILTKMDSNFVDFKLTQPWRDGGRDALGYYEISQPGKYNYPLRIDCALEAKCYAGNTGVGVRQMSRLISRIRDRQFGIMVTTSYVDIQAYKEVMEDRHPVLIVTASDIASILRNNAVNHSNIDLWLDQVDKMIV